MRGWFHKVSILPLNPRHDLLNRFVAYQLRKKKKKNLEIDLQVIS